MKKLLKLGLVLSCSLLLGACDGDNEGTKDSSTNATETSKVKEEDLLVNHEKYSKLASNNGAKEAEVVAQKDYPVSWSDNTWSGVTVGIDEVSVLKLDNYENFSGKKFPGFIVAHYTINNAERDLSLFPELGTIETNTEVKESGLYEFDHFADNLTPGSQVEGYAAYPLTELDSVKGINQVRIKFSGKYTTEDTSDTNANHIYDVTLDLE